MEIHGIRPLFYGNWRIYFGAPPLISHSTSSISHQYPNVSHIFHHIYHRIQPLLNQLINHENHRVFSKMCFPKCFFFQTKKLVGGLEHQFYFPIYWVANHPNWRTHILQRVAQPPSRKSEVARFSCGFFETFPFSLWTWLDGFLCQTEMPQAPTCLILGPLTI